MVVDVSGGVPVYRWEGARPASIPIVNANSLVQGGVSVPPSIGEVLTIAPAALRRIPVQPSGSARSSVSLASGYLNQAGPKTKITGNHTTVRNDPTIASWAGEVPTVVGPVQYAPARSVSQRPPLVRVTVNRAPRYYSRPLDYRQSPHTMTMANLPYPDVNKQVKMAQRPSSAPPRTVVPPSHLTSSSGSSSLSASPSMFIPKDAIHGKATQVEIFASPYYAPYDNRPASLGPNSHNTRPRMAHPGLQAGRYMPPQRFPAFPAFPPFPSFPAVSHISIPAQVSLVTERA
jgi:hypothetical protein